MELKHNSVGAELVCVSVHNVCVFLLTVEKDIRVASSDSAEEKR